MRRIKVLIAVCWLHILEVSCTTYQDGKDQSYLLSPDKDDIKEIAVDNDVTDEELVSKKNDDRSSTEVIVLPSNPWTLAHNNKQNLPLSLINQIMMQRIKKDKNEASLPWLMDLRSPMLRGKKSPDGKIMEYVKEKTNDEDEVPWHVMYRLLTRGKKTTTNLPWNFDLRSPMLRGKKSDQNLVERNQNQEYYGSPSQVKISPLPTTSVPFDFVIESPIEKYKNPTTPLPTQSSEPNQISRGKKDSKSDFSASLPWEFTIQTPMLRGKKKYNYFYIPPAWKYYQQLRDHKGVTHKRDPMLRGKKSYSYFSMVPPAWQYYQQRKEDEEMNKRDPEQV